MSKFSAMLNPLLIKRLSALVGVALIFVALAAGDDTARELLRYQRDKVAAGEWWRLITGHFVHLGWRHLWLNLAGWFLIGWLFGPDYRPRQWLAIALSGMACMGAGFFWLDAGLAWYVGLSGLLHTAIVAGMLAWAAEGDRLALVALGVVAVKLAWEQLAGPVPLTAEAAGGPVVVNAHLYGAVGGLVASGIILRTRKSV